MLHPWFSVEDFHFQSKLVFIKIKEKVQKQSPGRVLQKKDVLKNVTKFTGKPLCLSIFVSKVASLRPELNCSPEAYLELRQTFVKYDNTSGTFDVDYKIWRLKPY